MIGVLRRPLAWLAAHDPGWYAGHRAVRAAVVVPAVFAFATFAIGDAQVATFAAFGSFALLLFVEFPGTYAGRLGSYAVLGAVGVLVIALGTVLSSPTWLAVLAMAVVAFTILFLGVLSSAMAAAGRAGLLPFILAVMLPGLTSDIPLRIAGWALAWALSVPVAVLVWPPRQQNVLRARTADACRALAALLHPDQPPVGEGDPLVAASRSITALRAAFRASAARPVALSTGSRLLMRLVDELEWLSSVVINACSDAPETWPAAGLRLRLVAADVLASSARVLAHDGAGPSRDGCERLEDCLARLEHSRQDIAEETLAALSSAAVGTPVAGTGSAVVAGEFDRPLYAAHQLGFAVSLTGTTAAVIGAADARSWFARLAGRAPTGTSTGELAAAEQIAAGHLDSRSVWLQNSLRAAAGLAGAVLIAHLSGVQHGFWVVLGALSVVRSNALSTGATAVRALAGTTIGFVVGALLLEAMGTDHAVLWPLLPVAVLVAAFAPDAISFAAGQAAFTLVVVILFNLIAPEGWTIGLLRVEDVAIGCAAGLVAGVLFWPRGAAAALGRSLGDAYRTANDYFSVAVTSIVRGNPSPADVHERARAAGWRLDDAMRQYLAERGAKGVPLESVTALVNGAAHLRLVGEAISRLRRQPRADDGPHRLQAPEQLLLHRADAVSDWYASLSSILSGSARDVPAAGVGSGDESFLDALLPAVTACGDTTQARAAEQLLWVGQYVGDANRLREELSGPATEVSHVRHLSRRIR